MDFSKTQADPRRRFIGIAFVVALHAVLLFGLMSGLARKEVEVARAPIETKVIEEITKPPPPPELPPPPPPKLEAPPPPPFIPPPEVQVAVPPPPAPAITATPTPPPPAPVPIAPTVPVPTPAPPTTPPAPPSLSVSCPGHKELMNEAGFPRAASLAQLTAGEVTVSFTIGTKGEVKDVAIVKSTHRAFNRHSLEMVAQFRCIPQSQEVHTSVPLSYKAPE